MLRAAVACRRVRLRRSSWRATWLRWFALLVLVFAMPSSQDVISPVVSLIAHQADGCEDDCDDGDCCPAPCQACHCCAHAKALAVGAFAVPAFQAPGELLSLQPRERISAGYVSPPFRPPTS